MNDISLDYRLSAFPPFSVGDKRDCLPTVAFLIKLSETARKEGVLALESLMEEADTLFLKKGMGFVCDGIPPDTVRGILQNYLASSAHKGADLLKRLLCMDGLLALQSGEHPDILRERLLSLLGENFYEEACLWLGVQSDNYARVVEPFFENGEADTYPPGTNLLESPLLNMDNRTIQLLLRETDTDDFIRVFYGSSKKMQKKLCDNLSKRMAVFVINRCTANPAPGTGEIIAAQRAMLALYHQYMAQAQP